MKPVVVLFDGPTLDDLEVSYYDVSTNKVITDVQEMMIETSMIAHTTLNITPANGTLTIYLKNSSVYKLVATKLDDVSILNDNYDLLKSAFEVIKSE